MRKNDDNSDDNDDDDNDDSRANSGVRWGRRTERERGDSDACEVGFCLQLLEW